MYIIQILIRLEITQSLIDQLLKIHGTNSAPKTLQIDEIIHDIFQVWIFKGKLNNIEKFFHINNLDRLKHKLCFINHYEFWDNTSIALVFQIIVYCKLEKHLTGLLSVPREDLKNSKINDIKL